MQILRLLLYLSATEYLPNTIQSAKGIHHNPINNYYIGYTFLISLIRNHKFLHPAVLLIFFLMRKTSEF